MPSLASKKDEKKKCENQKKLAVAIFFEAFRERERESFSLKYDAIRPSAVFGTRRKAALRGEGFA